MPLPDGFIEDLKFKSDITGIVSGYVTLKRRGRNYVGICPFHNEKTASFNVYPDNGSFYCFGCGAGGDVITFIEKIENLDYMEAVKLLADRAGIEVPESSKENDGILSVKRRIFEANREAARFFHAKLYSKSGENALAYLQKRGLRPETIRKFGLGFAPNSRYELMDHLRQKGFKESELINANLAFSSYNKASARFFNRVMFPIIDLRGNVIAFGGRTMEDIKPKYLNTSDTVVFKKSANLFSMNFAKNESRENIILVEGYMDVIALYQAGFKNVVATLGTALTQEQAKMISKYTEEVVICYDSDEAGQKAANRAINFFREIGVDIKILQVPSGKDPDEFMRSHGDEGPARFKKLIENCNNDVEYQLQKSLKNYNIETAQGKIAYLKDAIKILAGLGSKIEQEIYGIKLAGLVAIDKATIMEQVAKEQKKNRKFAEKKEFREILSVASGRDDVNPQKKDNLRAANAEEALIAYIINNPEKGKIIGQKLPPDRFSTDFNRKVYKNLLDRTENLRPIGFMNISGDFTESERAKIAQILAKERNNFFEDKVADEYIRVIIEESEKIKEKDVASKGDAEIREYIRKLREQKK